MLRSICIPDYNAIVILDLAVNEIRQSLEFEKKQMLLEAKTKADAEKKCAVDETKRKQWCAYCSKEAIFYCCWNTSYCDYPCQQKHWPQHMHSCSQAANNSAANDKGTEGAVLLFCSKIFIKRCPQCAII